MSVGISLKLVMPSERNVLSLSSASSVNQRLMFNGEEKNSHCLVTVEVVSEFCLLECCALVCCRPQALPLTLRLHT